MTLDQEGANKHTNKRILVLGSAPHTRLVTAYTWDNLPKPLNIADYDVTILNLEPLGDAIVTGNGFSKNIPCC